MCSDRSRGRRKDSGRRNYISIYFVSYENRWKYQNFVPDQYGRKEVCRKGILPKVSRVEVANPEDGTISDCVVTYDGEECRIPVSLRPYQGICYIIKV